MKLGLKIILPILLLLIIILGAFGYLLYNLKQQEVVISSQTLKIQRLNGLNEQLNRQQEQTEHGVLDYEFNHNKELLLTISQAELDESKTLDEMSPFITTTRGRELVNSYIDSKKEIISLRNGLIKAIDGGDKEQINLNHNKWDIQIENIKAALSDIKAYNINSLEQTLAVFQDIRNKITQIIIILAFVVVTTIIFLYFYLRVAITVPIVKLAAVADQLAKADFTTTTTTTTTTGFNSNDEIGMLSRSFNAMGVKLKTYYSELEQKVRNRTQDLEDANAAARNVLEDLSGEKLTAETAAAKEDAILASIGDGIIAVDTTGKIITMNKKAEELLGWNTNEAIGKLYTDIISLEDEKGTVVSPEQRPLTKALARTTTTTTTTTYTKFYLVSKNQIKFPVAITISPIILDKGVIGFVEVFRDISRERQIDKMKTEFISLASHQLRTPLSAIKWFVELLRGTKMDNEQEEFSKNIADSTERMIQLVNALLNVSRIESGRISINPEPTDLAGLAREVIKELQPRVDEKGISLVFSAPAKLPNINIDPELIHEVYENLITNAVKYTPKKGKIAVSVFQKGQDLVSQIADTGLGIPDDEKVKVFSKFYRGTNIVKVEPEGTGLGLYLAKAIMESSQGRIWFESKEGGGTTFWFSLPLSGSPKKEGEVTISS